jgi:protein-L-isoaspartate(D-aspartate) O-methyltransferase
MLSDMVDFIAQYPAEQRVCDLRVLAAMRKVPREEFVPETVRHLAYTDTPLDIGEGQTISQPFMVGFMTQALELQTTDKVLEIGSGSGYQAAILAELASEVFTVEIRAPLARQAEATLARLGYRRIQIKVGDGYHGWAEHAPYDAIIATCASERIPPALIEQLRPGGRLTIPLGPGSDDLGGQELIVARKTSAGLREETRMPVRFVPMTGPRRPDR